MGVKKQDSDDFLQTLRGTVLSSIPATSALVFFAVAVKVFRAARMETATTVAIVSSADIPALLKGVILTLLPGFLAGVVAAGVWWWSGSIASADTETGEQASVEHSAWRGLFNPRSALMWSLLVMAFFTISWPAFLALFGPVAFCTVLLAIYTIRKSASNRLLRRMQVFLQAFGVLAAVTSIAWLALSPQVWLPLRLIEMKPGVVVTANGRQLPQRFGAYVLGTSEGATSLLMDEPRGVVYVPADAIKPNPPLCIHPASPLRWLFLRPSQISGLEGDYGSPYVECPPSTES